LSFSFLRAEEADLVKARLISDHTVITPGQTWNLGWYVQLKKDWHIYWQNPGDSGTAPELQWKNLPPGISLEAFRWPLPERIEVAPLMNFGYEREVVFPITAHFDKNTAFQGKVTLRANAKWLVCKEICLPGSAEQTLTLTAGNEAKVSPASELIHTWIKQLPEVPLKAPVLKAQASAEKIQLSGTTLPFPEAIVDFFPAFPGKIAHAVRPPFHKLSESEWKLILTPDSTLQSPLTQLDGLLVFSKSDQRVGYPISATISPIEENAMAETGLLRMALFAFIGGLILNLMPCVFPVLSIKIMGFVEQSKKSKGTIRLHGWLFTAGVMVSFWILAIALLLLRASGQKMGWGFQLQSPLFLFALSGLLLLMALNLLGVFEIGTRFMGVGSQLSGREGLLGSFFTGVLATIVATPCTAPFMGTAVGFALTQPASYALTVFTTLGLGMAFPYLLLSYVPMLLKWMPKPGRWMETMKQLMAFPLLATVIWLTWVFGLQTSMDGVLRLLFSYLFLALTVWLWARADTKNVFMIVGRISSIACLVAALTFGFQASQYRSPKNLTENVTEGGSYPVTWENYSEARLAALRREGKVVFLDFTAAWCVSCQVNEKLVFGSEAVRKRFQELGVVAMKADWTDGDPLITEALAKFNRSGIPFYLLYKKGEKTPPVILPEVLTPSIMLLALTDLT